MPRLLASLLLALAALAAVAAAPATADKPPSTRPVIVVAGTPPTEPGIRDLKRGKGRTALDGDRLTVHYTLVTWSDGKEKDASYGRRPFTFELGSGQVIEGWERGLKGMREGGRRRLILPPSLGYGEEGSPPAIAPNETLVFVVDLLRVRRG